MNLKPDPGFWKRLGFTLGTVSMILGFLALMCWAVTNLSTAQTTVAGLILIIVFLIGLHWKK